MHTGSYKLIYRLKQRYKYLKLFKIFSSHINTVLETYLRRLEGALKVLSRNAFYKLCNMTVSSSGEISGSHVGTVSGLGGHWSLTLDQVVDDEGRVVGCIAVVEFHRLFDVTPNAGDPVFQSRLVLSSGLCY